MNLKCQVVMSEAGERCGPNPFVECVMVEFLDLRLLDVHWPRDLAIIGSFICNVLDTIVALLNANPSNFNFDRPQAAKYTR